MHGNFGGGFEGREESVSLVLDEALGCLEILARELVRDFEERLVLRGEYVSWQSPLNVSSLERYVKDLRGVPEGDGSRG